LKLGEHQGKLAQSKSVSSSASNHEGTTSAVNQPNFIARHSVAVYFILATALAASVLALVVGGHLPPGFAASSMLSASIAGIVITAWEDGRPGLKLMVSRLLIWRVPIGYWLFACFFIGSVYLLGTMTNPLFGGDPFRFSVQERTFPFLPFFIFFFLAAGIGQELGWAGFLLPRLQARYSALTTSIIRAVLGGLWHLPLFLYSIHDHPSVSDFPYADWISQKGFLVAFGTSIVLFMIPWSIFFTWIFNNTRGSLLLVSVLHASEIWIAFWMMRCGINPGNLDNYWGYGAVMFAAAMIVVLVAGSKNLSRQYERIIHAASRQIRGQAES
jgi:membrane protease YdiL (CAAX protease family)